MTVASRFMIDSVSTAIRWPPAYSMRTGSAVATAVRRDRARRAFPTRSVVRRSNRRWQNVAVERRACGRRDDQPAAPVGREVAAAADFDGSRTSDRRRNDRGRARAGPADPICTNCRISGEGVPSKSRDCISASRMPGSLNRSSASRVADGPINANVRSCRYVQSLSGSNRPASTLAISGSARRRSR